MTQSLAQGRIASLWRHPVKGFTPERLAAARLPADGFFPCDRIYAVEDGPSGFDPAAPAWISKMRFAVLAKLAEVARVRTAYDETSGVLTALADGHPAFSGALTSPQGRDAFADWLTGFLGEETRGPLKVVAAPGHRFTDDPRGYVSIVNLASVRDLEARLGKAVDPLRFRANLYVEGWPAWIEQGLAEGATVRLGAARTEVLSTIVRCAATHVNPATGARDIDLTPALYHAYGHRDCGLYVRILEGAEVSEGDAAEINP
jgi:uncharacterized protein YcbX